MGEEAGGAAVPEAEALFVVTVNGPAARSDVVAGIEGVREALLRAFWSGTRDAAAAAPPDGFAAGMESLGDPAAWAAHGGGDGRPFWHWWLGLGDGSVSVQRVTGRLPADPRAAADAAGRAERLRRASAALADCAAELRAVSGRGERPSRLTLE